MHRGFFARALSDHAKDPLGSPYGSSVIAAYRSAGSLIALMRNLHSQLQEQMERMWFLWTHMFSCAVGTCQGLCDQFLTPFTPDYPGINCDTLSFPEFGTISTFAT
jgi:hypothetical protein